MNNTEHLGRKGKAFQAKALKKTPLSKRVPHDRISKPKKLAGKRAGKNSTEKVTNHPTLLDEPNRSHTLQEYIDAIRELDRDVIQEKEYGSILILQLVEEIGEISRAYLAEHGRKPTNIKAQRDETYKQELGDLIVSIMRLAIDKNINLDHRVLYTIKKIQRRRIKPKE